MSRPAFQVTSRMVPERVGPVCALVSTGGKRFEYHRIDPARWVPLRAYEVAA